MKTVSREFVGELINFAPTDEAKKRGFADAQLDGTVALYNMLCKNNIAYLADEVGVGKTYIALGVMGLVRYFNPHARVIVIAPRENIQRKWVKELRNFVRLNWQIRGNRVKSLQGEPAWEPVVCNSLLDFAHEALLHTDRDFFLRSTSFSLALKNPEARKKLRRELKNLVPWAVTEDALSSRSPEVFRDAFGAAINAAIPEADLVIVDEGHNLKHGFNEHSAIRNRVLGMAFGHPEGKALAGDWYGQRAKKLLILSATPFEEDYGALQRQFEIFGFGDAKLCAGNGSAPVSIRGLRDPDLSEEAKREIVGRLMVRRVSGLNVAGVFHTKNMYRREWRMGGYASHDEPMQIDDPTQRLIVALMQKKVAEILRDERFNNSFQIGMLSSFESFIESIGRSKRLAQRAAAAASSNANSEEEDEDQDRTFDGDQSASASERKGIDTEAISAIADSYRDLFGGSLPHPKLDTTAESLSDAFETGEKALVFVRRVRTVAELGAKLDRLYDESLRRRMEEALPELTSQVSELFERYERERKRGGPEVPDSDDVDSDEAEAIEQLEERGATEEDDDGSMETFFSWFFRGQGPKRILSGAGFQRNRLSGQSSVYAMLFEEDYVSWLMGRPGDVLAALAREVGVDTEEIVEQLRESAFGQFRELSQQATGYPRRVVFEAYQMAGLNLLAESNSELATQASIVLHERFRSSSAAAAATPPGFPGPEVGLGVQTFFVSLAARPDLRARIWPDEPDDDFRKRFRRREQRRELVSAMSRLGSAYVDLYLIAIGQLGSFALGTESDSEDVVASLATAYLDLLEKQANEPGFHAFNELANASANFDLLLGLNFPDVLMAPLHELTSLYGATLQRQVPVGRMSGGVSKRLVRQFRMPGFPLVLASTDVLQEGEDLHTFCRRVIHYGITWTPSAMEQRTGRIDRIGGLAQRELDGLAEQPDPNQWIQVFYPHLRDTVEVLQVQRVLKRLNKFLSLIHKSDGGSISTDSRIDTASEILNDLEVIKPIQGPLESAFPIREEFLCGELRARDVERPDVDGQIDSLQRHWSALQQDWAIASLPSHGELVRHGKAGIDRGSLAAAGADFTETQEFSLTLRSQAAGDATLLRCESFVGHLDLKNDRTLDALYELQIALGHPRICIEPDLRRRSDDVSIHHDILFHPTATQDADVKAMVERTVVAANTIHDELIAGRAHPVPKPRRSRRRRR